jgi:DNA primase
MRLRDSYDLRQVIPASPKRRCGSRYDLDCCPFHDDHNPSFIIWPDRFECKAGCGSGDIVEWTVRTTGLSKQDAIEQLRRGLPDFVEPIRRVEPKPVPLDDLPQSMGLQYHLDMDAEERQWYRRRGLSDRTIDHFQFGFAQPPGCLRKRFTIPLYEGGSLVNIRFRRDDRCPECGASATKEIDRDNHIWQCEYCEHEFEHPEMDHSRPVPDWFASRKYCGLKGRNGVYLYGRDELASEKLRAFIVEGEFDKAIMWQNGYTAVCATNGAESWSDEFAVHFLHIPRIYDLHDMDKAGRKGAKRISECIPKTRIVELPEKDVSEFFDRHTKEEFEALLQRVDRSASSNMMLRISNGLMRGAH